MSQLKARRTVTAVLPVLILAGLCAFLVRSGVQAAGPLCEDVVGARATCRAPVSFAARMKSPYTFEFDTGFQPSGLPIKAKAFYYASPGELDVKVSGDIVASWEAAQAYPGNSFPVRFQAEGIDSLSPWESDGGLRFGARYRYNVELGWTRFKKDGYVPGIPHMDISWPCKTTVQPYGLSSKELACVSFWGDVGDFPCVLKIPLESQDFPPPCDYDTSFQWSVSFASCYDGNPAKPLADSAKYVVTTRPAPPVKLSLGGDMGACASLWLDGEAIVDSTTGESITADGGAIEDSVEIPCSFAMATEDERVFYFTQGPFHYDANLTVGIVAKVEPHIIACIAQMLEVTFKLGATICPMVLPCPLFPDLSFPIPFSEMDATFGVPISEPEVCNISPCSGMVEVLDSIDITWNTSWGAPDPCSCRVDVHFQTRPSDSAPWVGWFPIYLDTLNTGSLAWYVPGPVWNQAQLRVRFEDPDGESLAVSIGSTFVMGVDLSSVEPHEDLPTEFALLPAYPNPFSGGVTIEFTVPTRREVRVRIYDARGRLVRNLFDGPAAPGYRVLNWNGDNNAGRTAGPGIYFVSVEARDKRLTQKIELLR